MLTSAKLFYRFLKLYPKGDARAQDKSLSIYLYLSDSDTLNEEEKIYTRIHLRHVDPSGSTHHTAEKCMLQTQ